MPVWIAASERALSDPDPLDIADTTLMPDVEISVPVGVNLTLLGASETEVPGEDSPEPYLQRINVPLFASSVAAASQGGVDMITLDRDFHVQPSPEPLSAALDGVTMAGKLAAGNARAPQICAEVPSDPAYIREAVALLTNDRVREATVMVTLQEGDDYEAYEKAANDARAAGVQLWLQAINPQVTAAHADVVARIFDAVRVRNTDKHAVRAMRFALRQEGRKLRREVPTFVDIGIVISATLQAAEERSILISQLNGSPLFSGFDSVVGTVYDVADAIESWAGMGAADGVILTPASLPTDLASILKGVLPLLSARATIEKGSN